MKRFRIAAFSWSVLVLAAPFTRTMLAAEAEDAYLLELAAPIDRWDEAIPLGNGLTGGLLWGEGNTINLSLDRGDLWDERLPEIYRQDNWNYATMKQLVAEKNQAEIVRLFDAPYQQVPFPTKLPGGRLVLTLGESQQAEAFELDMRTAVGRVHLGTGRLEVFFSAAKPVAMIRVPGPAPSLRIIRPAGLDKLGYEPAGFGRTGDVTWMEQKAARGLTYAVVVGHKRSGDETHLAVTIVSSGDGRDLLAVGTARVIEVLDAGYEAMLQPHQRWWADFWSISAVTVPDVRIQRHYNLVKYFYGAASRVGAPPMPLQGVWTADEGGLPPWKGDYHNDLNTQMTYLAYHAAGLLESGLCFVEYNWDLLPQYRSSARQFYGVDGAVVPGVATLAGQPTGGWSQYALSPTNGLWVGQTYYLHWRYTMDRDFLAQRAYPWLSEIAEAIVNLLEERAGKLYLPLSSSPEIHDNSMRAWLRPNSNYDLSLMQWAFEALTEMAGALGKTDEAARWRTLREKLDELDAEDGDGSLTFARGEPYRESHRHFSHAMAIHPLGILHIEGSERQRKIVDATVQLLHQTGPALWCGYSYSWFACLLARAGRPKMALDYLVDYERAFTLRNGFHANGDQTRSGLSRFTYRPFTLEGNFLAMEAVHEMLLQSWGGVVRVFPAVSERWADVAFEDLRAQGGFKVSAQRRARQTVLVRIQAGVDQTLRLRDPFGGQAVRWNRDDVRKAGPDYECELRAGEVLEARRAIPAQKSDGP